MPNWHKCSTIYLWCHNQFKALKYLYSKISWFPQVPCSILTSWSKLLCIQATLIISLWRESFETKMSTALRMWASVIMCDCLVWWGIKKTCHWKRVGLLFVFRARRWCVWTRAASWVSGGRVNYLKANELWLIGSDLFYLNSEIIWLFKVTLVRRWRSTLLIEVVLFFATGLLSMARSPGERLLGIKSSISSLFYVSSCRDRGEKHVYNLCRLRRRWHPIHHILEQSKQNIRCRRKQSLMVNNWFNTVW